MEVNIWSFCFARYITVEELTQALQEHDMGDEETIKTIIAEVDADKVRLLVGCDYHEI